MATILKIKRSSTNPTATPSGLGQGELAYGEGTSTYTDFQGASITSYGKLFVGRGTETNGIAANIDIIGGRYFTDLLDHGHGTITANSAAIVDSSKKVNEWNVDNITLDGNTISTTNSNGDLTIDTNGTGDVIISGANTLGTNLFTITDGTSTRFSVDTFSGALDISSPTLSAADTLLNIQSTWNNGSATFYGIDLDVTNTASASTSRLLNLSVGGADKFNVDLDGNVYLTGNISYANAVNFNIQDNTTDAFVVKEGSNKYIDIDTNDNAEKLTLGNTITSVDVVVEDNVTGAFTLKQGANQYIGVDTTDDAELLILGNNIAAVRTLVQDNDANAFSVKEGSNFYINVSTLDNGESVTIGNPLASVNVDLEDNSGNAFKVAQGATNYINVATTDDAEVITVGNTLSTIDNIIEDNKAAAFTIKEGANTYFKVDTTDSSELVTVGNNVAQVNVVVEDNIASAFVLKEGSNSYITVDTTNTSELITLSTGNVVIDNDLQIKGGDLTTNQTTFNLLNATATTVNFAGAATTVEIGAATGTTNINNNLDVDGDVNIDGGDLTVSTSTFNLANTNATTVNFAGAATTIEIGAATGTTNINNDLDVDGDVNIDGGDLTVSTATFNLANTTATTVNFAGAATSLNIGTAATEVDFGNLRIRDSVIYSESTAQTITIDPYPAGGDQGGNVVVRGNLQVSGTTTTVNSTVMTVNDPVFTLGDSISEKTVVSAALSGQPDVVLDSVDGLNVGDIVSGNAAIPGGTTILTITGTTITLSANLTTGIAASTNTSPVILTFTQGADDNKDRGIEFKYYNSGLKTGFFGYDESGTAEGAGTTYYFTYIPDATNTSQVFTGTVGSAYFNTTKLEIGINKGVPFFDQYKRLTTTAAAGTSDATTSYQVLTVDATGTPVWTTTIDGGTY